MICRKANAFQALYKVLKKIDGYEEDGLKYEVILNANKNQITIFFSSKEYIEMKTYGSYYRTRLIKHISIFYNTNQTLHKISPLSVDIIRAVRLKDKETYTLLRENCTGDDIGSFILNAEDISQEIKNVFVFNMDLINEIQSTN